MKLPALRLRQVALRLLLGLGAAAATVALIALWRARGAHPGAEHLLEALILVVRWEVPGQSLLVLALPLLTLLLPVPKGS